VPRSEATFTDALFERFLQLRHREGTPVCLDVLREMISAQLVVFAFDRLDTFLIEFLLREQSAKVAALVPKLDLMSRASADLDLLVRVASLLSAKTGTRAFDDWVLEQPAESPIFKLTDVSEFVFAGSEPIALPGLLPLCNPVATDPPYNQYLIGRYTIPVYIKLGRPFRAIPQIYMRYAIRQFIRQDDFEALFAEDCLYFAAFLDSECSLANLIEMFPGAGKSWVVVSVPFTFFSFRVEFVTKPRSRMSLIVFSTFSIDVDGLDVIGPPHATVGKIALGKWLTFAVFMDKARRQVHIYLEGKSIFCRRESDDSFESIGSQNAAPTCHYLVSTAVMISEGGNLDELRASPLSPRSECLACRGSGLVVRHNCLVDLFGNLGFISNFFYQLQTASDVSEFNAMVMLLCGVAPSLPSNTDQFFAQFRCSLAMRADMCSIFHLTLLTHVILQFPPQARNHLFLEPFLDFSLMGALPVALRATFVDCLSSEILTWFLSDFDFFCERLMFKFAVIYVLLNSSNCSGDSFLTFLRRLSMSVSPRYLAVLPEFLMIGGIWDGTAPVKPSDPTFESLILDYWKIQPVQVKLCILIIEIEQRRELELMRAQHQLLLRSLCP
jgi:hypothetical protein